MTQRAWYFYRYTVTIPTGTAVATPVRIPLTTGDIWCESIRVTVPPGPSGQMGFYIVQGSAIVVPWANIPQWLVMNDDTEEFDVQDETNSNLAVVGYNTGQFNHNVYISVKGYPAALIGQGEAGIINQIDSDELANAPATTAPAPEGSIPPNSDGTCPVGYQIDPGGSGYCAPLPAPPPGAVPPQANGSCALGFMLDPGGSGYCVAAPPPPYGSVPPNADGTCNAGYEIDPNGSGYCVLYTGDTIGVTT